jgi:beta-phosphoglucomutase-like phosphatase (HAD superfamily)
MNIALLEDNPAILDYMSTALRMAGHNVYTHVEIPSLLAALFDQEKVCSLPPMTLSSLICYCRAICLGSRPSIASAKASRQKHYLSSLFLRAVRTSWRRSKPASLIFLPCANLLK